MIDTVIGISRELIRQYPEILQHVDLSTVDFVSAEKEKAPLVTIEGLNKNAIALLSDTEVTSRYLITINEIKFEELPINKLQWVLLDTLLFIGDKCDGDINKHDFKSHTVIVNAIGKLGLNASYLSHPNLPDLLGEAHIPFYKY